MPKNTKRKDDHDLTKETLSNKKQSFMICLKIFWYYSSYFKYKFKIIHILLVFLLIHSLCSLENIKTLVPLSILPNQLALSPSCSTQNTQTNKLLSTQKPINHTAKHTNSPSETLSYTPKDLMPSHMIFALRVSFGLCFEYI